MSGGLQMPMFDPTADWTAPDLSALGGLSEHNCSWRPPDISRLPRFGDAQCITIDLECKDPNLKSLGNGAIRRDGHICGIGLGIEDGPKMYLPIRHKGGDNLPLEPVMKWFRGETARFSGDVLGAGLQYDLDWMRSEDIQLPNAKRIIDVQVVQTLIYELDRQMTLQACCERNGVQGKQEDTLTNAARAFGLAGKNDKEIKANIHRLPGRYVGEYGEGDIDAPVRVWRAQQKQIDAQNLHDVLDLEVAVTPILHKMHWRGVRIDTAKLQYVEDWAEKEELKSLQLIHRETGVYIPFGMVWKKAALLPLFQKLGLQLRATKKESGHFDYQIDALVFSKYGKVPAVKALHWARKVNKLRTTFAASVRRHMVNGRIHCKMNQIAMEADSDSGVQGARYGRMSCVLPNLQQQPSRDEFAELWRSIYIPEEGCEWVCADYSQQEPRMTTEYAARAKRRLRDGRMVPLTGAAAAVQAYIDNPDLDNHDFMSQLVFGEVTKDKRKMAKAIYLGLCYSQGGHKLCVGLGLPTAWAVRLPGKGIYRFRSQDEAMEACVGYGPKVRPYRCAGPEGQRILDQFDQRAPFIKQLSRACSDRAYTAGQIRTIGGRVLHFERSATGEYLYTYRALNRLIQGSAADQMKRAMVMVDRELPHVFLQLQVHDELDFSVQKRQEGRQVASIMSRAVKTRTPFKVDLEVGPNWGEIEEISA